MLTFRQFLTEDRIDPKSLNVQDLFHQFNRVYFNNELVHIPVKWGKTPARAAGVTTALSHRLQGQPIWMRKTDVSTIAITLKPFTYETNVLYGILAHEMVHAYNMQFNRHEKDSHGVYFREKVRQIQPKCNFDIPLKDYTPDEEEQAAAPMKPCVFIVAKKLDGGVAVALYSSTVLTKAHTFAAAHTVLNGFSKSVIEWASFGQGMTRLGSRLPQQRDISRRSAFYTLPEALTAITPTRIIDSMGPAPREWQA